MAGASFYAPGSMIITVGSVVVEGLSEQNAVTIERNKDIITPKFGLDGKMAGVINSDTSGKITLNLLQTSRSNYALSALLRLQDPKTAASVPYPIVIEDERANNILAFSPKAWCMRYPDINISVEMADVTWEFICEDIEMSPGNA